MIHFQEPYIVLHFGAIAQDLRVKYWTVYYYAEYDSS